MEVLISSVILLVTLVGAVTISVTSSMDSYQTGLRYQKEASIDADLAQIQRFNERYTCVSGTCLIQAGTAATMGKNDYFPDPVASDLRPDADHDGVADVAEGALEIIQNRCRYLNSLDLVTPLKDLIEASLPVPDGLQRTIAVDPTTQAGAHRYTVTYVDPTSNEVMRQMTLIPSAVAWCPRV
ncbi:MAG: hypothetical protein ACOVNL_08835 [Prochlorococcaceae cyanobacterium]